jgi:hypothetical protein
MAVAAIAGRDVVGDSPASGTACHAMSNAAAGIAAGASLIGARLITHPTTDPSIAAIGRWPAE